MIEIPVWEKELLTLDEAAALFGVGVNRLRDLTNEPHCDAVIWVGSRRMIKRRKMIDLIDKAVSI